MQTATRIAKLSKNGSSLSVVIPAPMCKSLRFKRGDHLVLWVDKRNNLVLKKMTLEGFNAMRA